MLHRGAHKGPHLPGCTDAKATKTSVNDSTSTPTGLALAGEAVAEEVGVANGDAVREGGALMPPANGETVFVARRVSAD